MKVYLVNVFLCFLAAFAADLTQTAVRNTCFLFA